MDKATDALELKPCNDDPDTHTWSDGYKEFDGGRGMTRYCAVCGLTSVEHTSRLWI